MLKTKSVTGSLPKSSELSQWLNNKSLLLSSRLRGWNGILIEQYENSSTPQSEQELPAMLSHWLILPLHSGLLVHKCDERLHESIYQKGDSLLVPAGQSSYWRCQGSKSNQTELHIHLQTELIEQVAEASEIDPLQLELINRIGKQDLHLQNIAMLLFSELYSDGLMGQLYVESLTQALVIYLLRHYSGTPKIITSVDRKLTHAQLQQVFDYIHAHLDQNLSLMQIAKVINISPTYFASLFKRTTGIAPHQYIIQQRVEKAKSLLSKTDLSIKEIALEVGFSNHSHLTQQFKCLTGITPKQVRSLL
ncbi:MAG: helix-turn-helix transcriptional regulator [Methylacidiphilales bacterium]|nr:helix-turn-helix transcriptional regulator [Candidatus Methylacidiphilales bacterium]NJR19305.1 helix-turn-helix transcriptional regulator [Calothrix sp. CSU_2_0]